MLNSVDWLEIFQFYLLTCFAYLYFYQKRQLLTVRKRIDMLEALQSTDRAVDDDDKG